MVPHIVRVFGAFGAVAGLLGFVVVSACASSSATVESPDGAAVADAGVLAADGATSTEGDALAQVDAGSETGATVPASDYCESIAGFFCDFYMRCGRMVAADANECRSVFLETCNQRYEPRDVDLATAGLLTLSRSGIDACQSHLATVACEKQPSDLLGPCAAMWVGTSPVGAPCGVDVESFVCAPGATCVVGLDYCGTCKQAVGVGEACGGDIRCTPDAACTSGVCVERGLPGASCDTDHPCLVGGSCTAGACVAAATVGEGASCDLTHRCAYRSVCRGGLCVKTSLLGEACADDAGCASGRCESAQCVPLRADGEACKSAAECASALCASGKCAGLPDACIAK